MQVVYLPGIWMVISFVGVWLVWQAGVSFLCTLIPDQWFHYDKGLFHSFRWENGMFYKTIIKVHIWKRLLPDGAAVTKGGFRKKKLNATSPEYIRKFLIESCRAELSHWLAIVPFWVFGFWAPAYVIPIMLVYALAVNLPCIIAQRYNRPRLRELLVKVGG
jgi:glycosyl-4,4'-diaponeurosporenoate acyltransferase